MGYGETLKPGDKALLKAPDSVAKKWSAEARKISGTVVIVCRLTDCKDGWWVEGKKMWFFHEHFHPVPESYNKRDLCSAPASGEYCRCDSPSLKENYASGKKFYYCTRCKKERVGI